MQIKPFFINSNICLKQDDISSYERFMTSIAGNTGNSYITYALIKELFGGLVDIRNIQNIYEYNFDNEDTDIDYINNEATHVFLILKDQIRIEESYGLKLPYKRIMNFISKLNKPVIIAGLGANSFNGFDSEFHKKLAPDLIDFLKFLSDHCVEIGIRGHYTEEVLHKIGVNNTRVIGCPSFYETGCNRIIKKQEISDLKSVLLTQRLPLYTPKLHKIMQDFQEQDIIKPIAFNMIEDNLLFQHVEPFYNQTYHIFSDIESWKKFVTQFKFALGNRIHGAILSINSGVPTLSMNKDSRATEMCSYLKIPHITNIDIKDENDILDIYEQIDYSEMNNFYPKLYDNFIDYLHKNNLLHYSENVEIHNKQEYIKQPSLNLYSNLFYANLDNKIFVNNRINEIMINQQEKINSLLTVIEEKNHELQSTIKVIQAEHEKVLAKIEISDNKNEELFKTQVDLNSRLITEVTNNIKAYISEVLEQPSFLQQIFSIRNEGMYIVGRILGITIKIRRKSK